MTVIIHPGRCDQAKECGCPDVCTRGAWYRDKEDKKWLINDSKCNDCGLCIRECPAKAVLLAETIKDKERILGQIANDTEHTPEKLFVERYGGMPIKNEIQISDKEFVSRILDDLVLIEFFNDDSLECLVKAVPYKDFVSDFKMAKVNVEEHQRLAEQYNIKKLPSLLVFRKGQEIGRISGFVDSKEKLQSRLAEIIK